MRPVQFQNSKGINLTQLKREMDRRLDLIKDIVKGLNSEKSCSQLSSFYHQTKNNYSQTSDNYSQKQDGFSQLKEITFSSKQNTKSTNNLAMSVKSILDQKQNSKYYNKENNQMQQTKTIPSLLYKSNQRKDFIKQLLLQSSKVQKKQKIQKKVFNKSFSNSLGSLIQQNQNPRIRISQQTKIKISNQMNCKIQTKIKRKQPKINNLRISLLKRLDDKHKSYQFINQKLI